MNRDSHYPWRSEKPLPLALSLRSFSWQASDSPPEHLGWHPACFAQAGSGHYRNGHEFSILGNRIDSCTGLQVINIAPCDQAERSGLVAIMARFVRKRGFQFSFSA